MNYKMTREAAFQGLSEGEWVTYLDDGLPSGDFQDLTLSGLSIAELHVHNLRVPANNQGERAVSRSVSQLGEERVHTAQSEGVLTLGT